MQNSYNFINEIDGASLYWYAEKKEGCPYNTVKKCMTQVIQLKGGKPVLDFRKLELNTTEPVYVQIVSFVKRQIFTGAAEKGESLPSRRELAAILKINPNTVGVPAHGGGKNYRNTAPCRQRHSLG